ncbi:type II toxin-antitoxin system VapC family toxin [Planotetraspora sp. A-T 1434]|uniref:type II toxin-antitoxin system VapC family toxin n=1 Tax=Planotetraspora sp. A-T 1434 TaxID=2979219 RepID=UPI0021C1BADF|nr:type II toxin-antitoxin system VapC family toxin [Planotetraspora sp. A-T 1434]MCT9934760.1 type II toxin-antitoxin system VapC family toxin [Planotetraspora sp. A-T 1434]
MILVDANVLIYAFIEEYPQHKAAQTWLDDQLSGRTRVGLPWPSLLAFARIVANPKLSEYPVPTQVAWAQVEAWLTAPPAWIPTPTDRHGEVLASLMPSATRFDLFPDAHLAALAIEHGLTMVSTDTDFARFSGLRWVNPLT